MDEKYIISKSKPVDTDNNNGIYFLINKGEIVYVGQTTMGLSRILTHVNKKDKKFDRYYFYRCQQEELNDLEAKYIIKFEPIYNTTMPSNNYYKSLMYIKDVFSICANDFKKLVIKYKIKNYYLGYYDIREIKKIIHTDNSSTC